MDTASAKRTLQTGGYGYTAWVDRHKVYLPKKGNMATPWRGRVEAVPSGWCVREEGRMRARLGRSGPARLRCGFVHGILWHLKCAHYIGAGWEQITVIPFPSPQGSLVPSGCWERREDASARSPGASG